MTRGTLGTELEMSFNARVVVVVEGRIDDWVLLQSVSSTPVLPTGWNHQKSVSFTWRNLGDVGQVVFHGAIHKEGFH